MGCGLATPEQECEIARIVRVAAKPTHTRIHCGGSLRAANFRESDALRSPTPRQSSNLGIRFLVDAFARPQHLVANFDRAFEKFTSHL